jgi:Concanavalin A-like lectin/glucanases superfamily
LGAYPAPNAVSIENGGTHFYWWTNGSYPVDKGGLSLSTNTWHHMAVTRDNGVLSIYINGVQQATGTFNDAIPSQGNILYVGAEPGDSIVNGKITNFRWNSSVIYSGPTYTVPTSLLTADSNTQLLLKATDSGHLTTDSSTFAHTITNNNGATWDSDSPFISGGGSINFAGTSYFTIPASTSWDL